jgi:hypothetical protein
MTKLISAVLLLLVALSASAKHSHNLFQNGSFETISIANNCNVFDIPAGSNIITGWTVSQGTIDWDGSFPCSLDPSNGTHSLDLVGAIGFGGIEQAVTTKIGHCYHVAFDLAGNPGGFGGSAIKPLLVNITPASSAIILSNPANAGSCGPIGGGGMSCSFSFDTTGKSATDMGWTTQKIKFMATSTSTNIEFFSDVRPAGGSLNAGAALDNVHAHKAKCE